MAKDSWQSVVDGVARGDFNLLLGAGASTDSTDRHGRKLPTAGELAEELTIGFKIPVQPDEVRTLGRAYEWARDRESPALDAFLRDRFTNVTPAPWLATLTRIHWAGIWNLNIDDALGQSYSKAAGRALQQFRPVSWDEPYKRQRSGDVLAIYLHGQASRASSNPGGDSGFVFDITEYLKASTTRHVWHRALGDTFAVEPFIVLGASLRDEIDLAPVLRAGSASLRLTGLPSIVVLRSISAVQRDEFERWGILPVEATAGEFVEAIERELPDVRLRLAREMPTGELTEEAQTFLRQFRPLRAGPEYIRDPRHDFYGGHDPEWPDILDELDARLESTERALAAVGLSHGPTLTLITGMPFTGKSTAAFRVARELIRAGLSPYLFRAEERIDVDAVHWWIQHRPGTTLVIDGLGDHSRDVARLMRQVESSRLSLVVIGTERDARRKVVDTDLTPMLASDPSQTRTGALSEADVKALIAKLAAARRLGRLTRANHAERVRYFRDSHRGELFSAMAELEQGPGFATRLRDETNGLSDSHRRVYAAASCAYALGYATPLPVLAAVSGLSVPRLVTDSSADPLAGLVKIDGRNLRPRHRRLASLVAEQVLGPTERYDVTLALATVIGPYVNPRTIGQRTLPYLIARRLMDQRVVTDWMQGDALRWYEQLANTWDWNARFWEQRALAEAHAGNLHLAESYAYRAVEVRRDGFTLNTLGTILMRRALLSSMSAGEFYERAVGALTESRSAREGDYEHPFVTYFEYTLRLVKSGSLEPTDAIRERWQHWIAFAAREPLFASGELRQRLTFYIEEWRVATSQ